MSGTRDEDGVRKGHEGPTSGPPAPPDLHDPPYLPGAPDGAEVVFGTGWAGACRFVELLAGPGREQGVIGPREVPRLWERHVLNSAAVGDVVPRGASVVDVGSGAGLPGIPLALARPDLAVTLLEPMARRVAWLEAVVVELGLSVTVVRGRAEERETRRRVEFHDVVTARAVAPLGRLVTWTLPLARPGGTLAAMKGSSAASEIDRDAKQIRTAGGVDPRVVRCGVGDAATHVVLVSRTEHGGRAPRTESGPASVRRSRGRKDREP